jgi:excisionase family DNA binding protein
VCHAEALLTLEEVAAWLSVAATVVEELVASGELRVLRIGQERRVRPADLEALLRTTEQ